MDLEDKLKNLDRFNLTRSSTGSANQSADKLVEILGATTVENASGEFVLAREGFDERRLRQQMGLPLSCETAGEWLARICSPRKWISQEEGRAGFDLKEVVFLDCETTGLAGGVGTYAFLVGLGYLSGKEFWVEQYFMQDFHQERAVLTAVAERMRGFKSLVSFNGKCYDLPLLENRFVINRMDFDSADWTHFDLLFPCRRLWKRRIGECNLGNIEQKILGVRRKIDVPSFLVPQIYFDYLRTGETEPLIRVFHHNVYDILSLFGLYVLIDQTLEDFDLRGIGDPIDLYSLGRIHEILGNCETALRCFRQALAAKPLPDWEQEICLRLAFVCKRAERIEEAASIWQNLTGGGFTFSFYAHEELAKYYEHKKKDYDEALSLVQKAIARLNADLQVSSAPAHQRRLSSLEYRKSRLERKIKKAAQRG